MQTSPSPLSPAFERGLSNLREFLAPYPLLAAGVTSYRVDPDNGEVNARWSYLDGTYAEKQAAALQAREAGKWTKKRGISNTYDYFVERDGVRVEITMAEPIPLAKESPEIDWNSIAIL